MIRSFAAMVLSLMALFTARLPAQAMQLTDGKLLLAEVTDASGDGLRVRRLDNGGVPALRWAQLTPEAAQCVKEHFKLSAEAETELTVSAWEVHYYKDGKPMTLIGRLVDNPASPTLTVLVKGEQYQIPRMDMGPHPR